MSSAGTKPGATARCEVRTDEDLRVGTETGTSREDRLVFLKAKLWRERKRKQELYAQL